MERGRAFAAALALLLATLATLVRAQAAGGAYAVDDSEIGKPGECKVETWVSFASNTDFVGAVGPACAVSLGRPVELGMQYARVGSGGEWSSALTFKGKTNLIPVEANGIGVGLSAGVIHNVSQYHVSDVFILVPVTFQVHEQLRLNLNGGWLWNPQEQKHFAAWGAGFEWNFVKPLTLIGEVFGFIGPAENKNPRAQVGMRFTPVESFDIDLIYGRNILGEDANWITLGLNVRFDAK